MTVTLSFSGLGPLSANVEMARDSLRDQQVAQRIIERDHTVWKADPTEISNRLGWIEVFRTCICAIHNGMTTVQSEWIFEFVEPISCSLVA